MVAVASFGFNVSKKGKFTMGGDEAIPNAENNPSVAAGVIFTKPGKVTIRE